jgi:GntR family transcriptional regulator of vanillate catabolism
VKTLRDGILEGEYGGGMRMNENDLAEALNVSRTPVRAALSILAAEGLLKYTPNSGFVVQTFTAKDIEGIYELRSTLAGLAARLAAHNGLGEDRLSRLHMIVAQCRNLLDHADWAEETIQRWEMHNEDFHALIDGAADNIHLEAALQRTRDIPVLKEIRYRWMDPETLSRNHQSHVDILDAVWRGQQRRAEDLTREHVYQNGQRMVQQWRSLELRNADRHPDKVHKDSIDAGHVPRASSTVTI